MLDVLKKIFFYNKEKHTSLTPGPSNEESAENPNFLTSPDKIHQLLKDIEDASPLCTISIDGIKEEFSSSILDIQLESKQIILDELSPKHGHELLINQNKLKLSTFYNGIHLAFNLSGIKAGSSHGIPYYKAFLPNRIYYPQRRSSPRRIMHYTTISFSGISSKNQSAVGGEVFDISREGIGVSLPNNRARFQRGDLVKNCQIIIDDHTMTFDLAVSFVKKSKQRNDKTQIGGYFKKISAKSRNKLEHFVLTIEREQIRIRKRKE